MAFNNSSLLAAATQDIIYGLRNERGAFADGVCTRLSRLALTGSDFSIPTGQTLAQPSTAQAIGADIKSRNLEGAPIAWTMKEIAALIRIPEATIVDLSQYMQPLSELAESLMQDVDSGVDALLASLLVSATYNLSQAAATGVWSLSTSTPTLDMQAAKNKSPGADMVILGQTSAQELARHPDTKEAMSNYSGTGAVTLSAMQAYVGGALDIDPSRVFVFGKFYNSANPGQTSATAYRAGDLCWIGHQKGLRLYEQGNPTNGTPSNGGIVTVVENHNVLETAYRRTLDVVRGDKDLGVYLTGL
jgi:hypothetical protein